jgi:hypothetical protein
VGLKLTHELDCFLLGSNRALPVAAGGLLVGRGRFRRQHGHWFLLYENLEFNLCQTRSCGQDFCLQSVRAN